MTKNKDKGTLMAKKGRKWLYSFPLNPNAKINPDIKSEEARENKRRN